MSRNIPIFFAIIGAAVAVGTNFTLDRSRAPAPLAKVEIPMGSSYSASSDSVAGSVCEAMFQCGDNSDRELFLNAWLGDEVRNDYASILPPEVEWSTETCPLAMEEILPEIGFDVSTEDVRNEICFALDDTI
jgi:hypothetical protein